MDEKQNKFTIEVNFTVKENYQSENTKDETQNSLIKNEIEFLVKYIELLEKDLKELKRKMRCVEAENGRAR